MASKVDGILCAVMMEVMVGFMISITSMVKWTEKEDRERAIGVGCVIGLSLSVFGQSWGIADNPIRYLAALLYNWYWKEIYIYVIAPFVGFGIAFLANRYGFNEIDDNENWEKIGN